LNPARKWPKAQLESAQAAAELAQANLQRINSLQGTGALAEREVDDSASQAKQTKAEVSRLKAVIERKTIRAPFTGRTGIREVNLGKYLSAGAAVVALQTLDPIYVDFSLPQQDIGNISAGQTVKVSVDAFPGKPMEGKITAINPQVDDATRNIRLQATLDNKDEKLRPGMYARVSVVLESADKFITVPGTAINRAPYGDTIYVIENMKDAKGKEYLGVRQQAIKTGPTRGDQVAVVEGLKGGEEIVTSGLFKLRPAAAVLINNEIMPGNKSAPKPADS
jgi:membrane fusion protein (multidrug efflux system)